MHEKTQTLKWHVECLLSGTVKQSLKKKIITMPMQFLLVGEKVFCANNTRKFIGQL